MITKEEYRISENEENPNQKDGKWIEKSIEFYMAVMADIRKNNGKINDFFTYLDTMFKERKGKVYDSDLIGIMYCMAMEYIISSPQGKKAYAIQQILEFIAIGVDRTAVTQEEDGLDIHLFFPKSGGIETETKFIPPF